MNIMVENIDIAYWMLLGFGLVMTGCVAGVLAGLLGVGGGIVIVPVLTWLLALVAFPSEAAQHLIVATSLATIIPTAISSVRVHHKRGAVDFRILRLWGPALFIGALVGGVLSSFVSGDSLRVVFGFIALAVSINMVLPKKPYLATRCLHHGSLLGQQHAELVYSLH